MAVKTERISTVVAPFEVYAIHSYCPGAPRAFQGDGVPLEGEEERCTDREIIRE
jgi:hypothetical protein